MAGKRLFPGRQMMGALAAFGLIATGLVLGAGPATADELVHIDPDGIPVATEELDAVQLDLIAETQTPEEIKEIVAMAAPDQWVQTYADGETFELLAAVLLENPPTPEGTDALIPLSEEDNPSGGFQAAAVQYCNPTSGPKSTTNHTAPDRTFGWCGTGSWTGTATGWYRTSNFTGGSIRAGSSTTSYVTVPAYTANTLMSAQTLRYVGM